MDAILEMFNRGVEQLLGRASGPLQFRFLVMPTVVTVLAVRAGIRDARLGQQTFLWAFLTKPNKRSFLLRSALKDIGRIFLVAVLLDTAYQVFVLRAFYVVQLLIVAFGCAVVPYVVIRGPVTLLLRGLYQDRANAADGSAANDLPDVEGSE